MGKTAVGDTDARMWCARYPRSFMYPRICHIGGTEDAPLPEGLLDEVAGLGFDTVLASAGAFPRDTSEKAWRALSDGCIQRDLALLAHINISELDLNHPLVERYPDCFSVRYDADPGAVIDPRTPDARKGRAQWRASGDAEPVAAWWNDIVALLMDTGVAGLCVRRPAMGAGLWQTMIPRARSRSNRQLLFIADTPGTPWSDLPALARCDFDYTLSSLPWWDGRANWLVEEYDALARVAAPIAMVEAPGKHAPASLVARRARLALAAVTGSGVMMPASFMTDSSDGNVDALAAPVRRLNDFVAAQGPGTKRLLKPTGAGANVTVLLRIDGPDARLWNNASVCFLNPDAILAAEAGCETRGALGDFDALEPVTGLDEGSEFRLAPGEARLYRAARTTAIRRRPDTTGSEAAAAAAQSRVMIAAVSPVIDDGRFAAKRIVGERIDIEGDIFSDGHPLIAASLIWRADDEDEWHRSNMHAVKNDRWRASIELARVGRYRFAVEAWPDGYGSFARDLARKRDAGQEAALELKEGADLINAAHLRAASPLRAALRKITAAMKKASPDGRAALLLAPETIEAMHRADNRPSLARSAEYFIEAERKAASFASWYELFPRSQTDSPQRSGTLRDTIERLPAIRDMGFDVLYLTPIHPIGLTNRKGRNNALEAAPGDPGSPYAIGSPDGGHDAIHPELGTFEDFRALVTSAYEHGMELALDFAIQCSPDHPWLTEHPGWFAWRSNGSIRYAENPPKKYEDIVNIDFHAPDAAPAAWIALRDVVLTWIDAGVRIFRVDNPHTKPFPFWEWLIGDVRSIHPNVIFLSEAFTRPKIMYHLAKLGFSQSYTYFVWRNTKQELTDYMTELTQPPVSDFFRPHFFVNTPDINPLFLQHSGRAGFLIRAALASTLSGLWGMYSGFELCEAAALPGREEYLDSEKYEIRPRDWNAPGNIIPEIAQLNRLRKAEPSLQSHMGLTFYNAFNDQILYYGKHAPAHRDRILIAVSLDPHHAQEADFEIPLWEWGLSDRETLEAEDLLRGHRFTWRGKMRRMRLTPDAPYAIWRVSPARET
jgi:starch synthase (maltosyl-transferring)